MKPSPFSYHRPTDIDGAVALLAQLEDTKVLAGGQSLMPMMNYRYLAPEHLIDINRIDALSGIQVQRGRVRIGAMTRQRELKENATLQACCPLLSAALHWVGHIPTRNRGTVGGSLSHLDPAAELPAVFLALDATLEVRSQRATRLVSIHDWALGYMTPDIEEDELLCAISFELPTASHGYGFHEFARRHGDFALAGAAVLIECGANSIVERVAIALTGVDMIPIRLSAAEATLTGQLLDADAIANAAAFSRDVPGLDDIHASAAYRRKIAAVMTRRALSDAAQLALPGDLA